MMSPGELFAVLADICDKPATFPDRHFAGGRAIAERSRGARYRNFIGWKRSWVKLVTGYRRWQRVKRVSVHHKPPSFTLTKREQPGWVQTIAGGACLIHSPGCVLVSEVNRALT